MDQVHKHPHSVLEHCVCLLSLFCFLFLWLRNKICFAGVKGTQTTRFLIRMNNKISYLQRLQRTTSDGSGTQIFTQSMRTLCLPPITFLLMWLRYKIHFTFVASKKTNKIFNQSEPQNISFERVAEDNIRWVRCTNIHIEY